MRRTLRKPPIFRSVLVLLIVMNGSQASELRKVRGRVVDEAGRPVAGASVAKFWSGNGTGKRPDGTPLDLNKDEELRAFWGHLGQMEPRVRSAATTGPDGSFSIEIPEDAHTIMAMDARRGRGGLAVLPKGNETMPVELKLGPLVRVRASFEGPGAGKRPHWTHVYVKVPEDPTRPLDSDRLVSCGSLEAKLDVWLPPGPYVIEAHSQLADKELSGGELIPDRAIVLGTETTDVDFAFSRT